MKYSKLIKKLDDQQKSDLKYVLKLAKSCNFEARHTKQVTKLALKIFDDLQDLHKLGPKEKFTLLCGGLLHDIGVHTEGPKNHHKIALKIILDTPILQFDNKTRLIIGSVARYHRGTLPSTKHDHYKSLTSEERNIVSILSGILKVADGLDYSHKNRIREIRASFIKKIIQFDCLAKKATVKKEISSAVKKADLLRQQFKRDLVFKVLSINECTGYS
jgi:exopolyphosphatase/pppGpp-phosphohydrolase